MMGRQNHVRGRTVWRLRVFFGRRCAVSYRCLPPLFAAAVSTRRLHFREIL
jgi:hypothetical protein